MLKVVYNKNINCPFSEVSVKQIVKTAARFEKKIDGLVEISVVSDKIIKELNKKYRGKEKVTDVLSFSMREGGIIAGPFFGEIYLCYPQIVRQAKVYGVTSNEEFRRMLVHGLLHLCGYDHIKKNDSKKMFSLQEQIITADSVK